MSAYDNPDPELIDATEDIENDVTMIRVRDVTTASSSTDHHSPYSDDDDIETIKIGVRYICIQEILFVFKR